MKSKAVLFTGVNQVAFDEVDLPDPASDDVVIETRYSWISNGTEGSFLRGERFDGITPWDPHTMPPPFPMVPGYQKVGRIVEIGPEVKGLHVGQWVFTTITRLPHMHLGFGGHIAYGPSAAAQVYALPEDDDPLKYAGLVLTQVGYNSGSRPPVTETTHALVMGDGMVGLWAAQTLQQRGAAVALVGRHDFRLGLWKRRTQNLALNSHQADWLDHAREWSGGAFDLVVDTVGNHTNYDLNLRLIEMIRREGHYVTAGHEGDHGTMDLKHFILREITLHCPAGWTRPRLEITRDWVAQGHLETLPLITDRLPAHQAAEAWDRIFKQKDNTLGVILDWFA